MNLQQVWRTRVQNYFLFWNSKKSSLWAEAKQKWSSLTDKFSFPCFFNIMAGSSVERIKVTVIDGNNNNLFNSQFNWGNHRELLFSHPLSKAAPKNCGCRILTLKIKIKFLFGKCLISFCYSPILSKNSSKAWWRLGKCSLFSSKSHIKHRDFSRGGVRK